MNVELLDTDAAGCSVTEINCGGDRSIFLLNEHNSTSTYVSVSWHPSVDCSAIPPAQLQFDSLVADFKI